MNDQIYGKEYLAKFTRLEDIKATWELNKWRAVQTFIATKDVSPLIIDVGCAAGTFLKSLKQVCPAIRSIGVDINPLAVAECTVHGIESYTNEQLEFLWDDYFLSVEDTTMTFWDSLEHMRDPIGFLKRYSPKFVLVSIPCLDGFLERNTMFDICMWKHYRPLEHLWNFTEIQFVEFMKKAGYRVIHGPMWNENYWRKDEELGMRNIMTFSFTRV